MTGISCATIPTSDHSSFDTLEQAITTIVAAAAGARARQQRSIDYGHDEQLRLQATADVTKAIAAFKQSAASARSDRQGAHVSNLRRELAGRRLRSPTSRDRFAAWRCWYFSAGRGFGASQNIGP
jgi:hypothetical protein